MKRIGILGGTFNPPHIMHIRPAVEVNEAFRLDRIDFVPCATPPHKTENGLLSFELRNRMIRAAINRYPTFTVNELEVERSGPSYTYDTLQHYKETEGDCELFFIMGSIDLPTLADWHRGLELIDHANIIVLARSDADVEMFNSLCPQYWPNLELLPPAGNVAAAYSLGTHNIYFLPQPRIDVSATLIRERWLQDLDISYLVPDSVLKIMGDYADIITACWSDERNCK
jgi:nicotinate-nucleotide adenylyltransferase